MSRIKSVKLSNVNVDKTSISLKTQHISNSSQSQLSLIKPDLSGLHDTIYYKTGETTLLTKIGSMLNWIVFTHTFVIGIPLSIITCYLLIFGESHYRITAAIIALIIIYPYVLPLKPNYSFSKFMNSWYPHYFDGGVTLSFMTERPSNIYKKGGEILCAHPHGILCNGIASTIIAPAAHAILESKRLSKNEICSKVLAANLPSKCAVDPKLYQSPIYNYLGQMTDSFTSVSKENMVALMRKNQSFSMFPGGFYELGEYQYGKDVVVVPGGFIKYALQYGYKITPCYAFGGNKTYYQFIKGDDKSCRIIKKIKDYLSSKSLPFIFFLGKWYDPLLPNSNIGIHTIIGPSIQCPKISDRPITTNDVETYQKLYIDELKKLFDENKWRFGLDRAELIVKRL